MMEITKDEAMLIMIYSPGYRKGLISELEQMKLNFKVMKHNLNL